MELPQPDGPCVDAGAATDAGPRPDNQDRCAVSSRWAVVSDGVGGHAGGAVAAELTVEAAVGVLDGAAGGAGEDLLRRAITAANDAVRARRRDDPAVAGMGATLTVAAVVGAAEPAGTRWLVASVGDSPAWLVTEALAVRLTEDHTVAGELLRAGALSPEEAARHPGRNVVVRSIGGEDRVEPDVAAVTLAPGEAIVIASDGVGDVLPPAEIHAVTVAAASAGEAARRLVAAALARDATDNVTAAVVRHLPS